MLQARCSTNTANSTKSQRQSTANHQAVEIQSAFTTYSQIQLSDHPHQLWSTVSDEVILVRIKSVCCELAQTVNCIDVSMLMWSETEDEPHGRAMSLTTFVVNVVSIST